MSGRLAPAGSSGADADPHTDDTAESRRLGSTPLWKNTGGWVTWAVFLFAAYFVYRIAVR